jgi:hypothetical protein
MKVTIVGGWSESPEDNKDWQVDVADPATFIAACESIGERLAEKGHTIVVGSEKENSADPHVVRGYLKSATPTGPDGAIEVIEGIQGEKVLYRNERKSEKHQRIFSGKRTSFSGPQPPRAAEKIVATRDADALIAIGGLNDTYVAGIAAMLGRKPVVPFASFGGAALQLWRALHMLDQKRLTEDFKRLSDPMWHDRLIDAAFRFGGLDRTRVFLGSCGKAHDTASKIKKYVEDLGFNVVFWEEDFEPGKVILDEIREASFSCKYAMLLLTPDDPIQGEQVRWIPRDNVVFELGYFINALGVERTLVIVHKTKVLVDYSGYIYVSLPDDANISSIEKDLRRFLSSDLPQ